MYLRLFLLLYTKFISDNIHITWLFCFLRNTVLIAKDYNPFARVAVDPDRERSGKAFDSKPIILIPFVERPFLTGFLQEPLFNILRRRCL